MKNTSTYWIIFISKLVLLNFLVCPSLANEVSLAQVLESAQAQHPSVVQARNQAQAAGYDVDAAKWGRYPSLSTELRSDTGSNQSVTKLEQPVWSAGKIPARIALSEATQRAAEAGIKEAELTAISQAAFAFFEVLRLQDRLQSSNSNVAEHERLLALIERRAKAEVTPPADATLAKARLQQAVSEQIQIKRQLDTALVSLVEWGGPVQGALRIPKTIHFKTPASLAQLQNEVLTHSAHRQRVTAQIESAEAQIKVSQTQIYPSLIAGYQYSRGGQVPVGTDRGQAYLSFQFQTGAGLSALSSVQAAVSRKAAAQSELETLDRQLSSQASSLLNELQALLAQVKPAQALQDGTAEIVESYLRQYQVGRKSWLDVLNAQREKTQALYGLADAQYGLQLAQIRLIILTGDLTSRPMTAIHD